MKFEDRLKKINERYEFLNNQLSHPETIPSQDFAKVAKEHSDISEINDCAVKYIKTSKELSEAEEMLVSESDIDLKKLAEEDIRDSKKILIDLKENLKLMLLPKDAADDKGAILEIRAGTGGDEAALFAAALFNMYNKYIEKMKWKMEVLALSESALDGYKEIMVSISGKGVYRRLKYESGVHRVQRVPATESSGRIHTSAATVAVLPEAEEIDVKIEDKDIRIDSYRASGAGGQHVNTTDSAIRITHIPTGIIVVQAEKSQHQNKAKALKILRSKLYELERKKKDNEISQMRKGQIGTGDRSERIRTYNFPQNRITDHRINLTLYNLEEILSEGILDDLINNLITEDQAEKLAQHE
ncbi:MAG: peptide chain release factor 1 [Candidatus Midichloriaceae bacterium]|jgi:peptide chain release factor 1